MERFTTPVRPSERALAAVDEKLWALSARLKKRLGPKRFFRWDFKQERWT
jgi:hypothetical protein